MKRPECQGCVFDGKAVHCAVLDLQWAWYDLMKTLPFINRYVKEPDPCYFKEVAPDENA